MDEPLKPYNDHKMHLWPYVIRHYPLYHPLFWSPIALAAIFLPVAGMLHVANRPVVLIGFMLIYLLLQVGWCTWFLAFALAPQDSWATALRFRLRALGGEFRSGPPGTNFAPDWILVVIIPVANSLFSVLPIGIAMKVYETSSPGGTLLADLGLNSLWGAWLFQSGLTLGVLAGIAIVFSRMKGGTRNGEYHCLNCGEGVTREPTDRCPECGEEASFTLGPPIQFWDWMAGKRE